MFKQCLFDIVKYFLALSEVKEISNPSLEINSDDRTRVFFLVQHLNDCED